MSEAPPARVLPPVTSSLQQPASVVGAQAARTAQRIIESERSGRVTGINSKPAGEGAPPTTTPIVLAGASPQVPTIRKTTLGSLAEAVENIHGDDGTEDLQEFDAGAFLKRRVPQKRITGSALAGAVLKRMRKA